MIRFKACFRLCCMLLTISMMVTLLELLLHRLFLAPSILQKSADASANSTSDDATTSKPLRLPPKFTSDELLRLAQSVISEPQIREAQYHFTTKSPRIAILCYIPHVEITNYYATQFACLLYSSWRYITNATNLAARSKIPGYPPNQLPLLPDILAFCHPIACKQLPPTCSEYSLGANAALTWPRCFFVKYSDHPASRFHGPINSLAFAGHPQFSSIIQPYEYIAKMDMDVVLTPAFLSWLPPDGVPAAFSDGKYSSAFASNRLRNIAARMNLTHQRVHSIGSSWYAKPSLVPSILQLGLKLAEHFAQHEFNKSLPGLEHFFDKHPHGIWPDWWQGVSSMYATELAFNHVIANLSRCMLKDQLLDHHSCSERSALSVLQIHCFHNDCDFQKFQFMDVVITMQKARMLDPRVFMFHAFRDVTNMSCAQYANYIAWNGAARYDPLISRWTATALTEK